MIIGRMLEINLEYFTDRQMVGWLFCFLSRVAGVAKPRALIRDAQSFPKWPRNGLTMGLRGWFLVHLNLRDEPDRSS